MSIISTCSLKFSPRQATKPQQQRVLASERNRFAAGIAVAVIGFELASLTAGADIALAIGDSKWSDKRACPAWQMNSLETIVPENLPRPSAKRRWEIVGFDSSGSDPAAIRIRVFRNGNGCFSM